MVLSEENEPLRLAIEKKLRVESEVRPLVMQLATVALWVGFLFAMLLFWACFFVGLVKIFWWFVGILVQ